MAKQVIRLTESRLRQLVESCVRETMEDMVEEGYGWDVLKYTTKDDMSDMPWPKKGEMSDLINGDPNDKKYQYNKLMYNQAKNGQIDNGDTPNTLGKYAYVPDEGDYAFNAFNHEPGFKGKMRRAGVAAGVLGKQAFDKGKAAIKRGVQNMRGRKKGGKTFDDEGGNYPSFTL
jgi:hypothetical protein